MAVKKVIEKVAKKVAKKVAPKKEVVVETPICTNCNGSGLKCLECGCEG